MHILRDSYWWLCTADNLVIKTTHHPLIVKSSGKRLYTKDFPQQTLDILKMPVLPRLPLDPKHAVFIINIVIIWLLFSVKDVSMFCGFVRICNRKKVWWRIKCLHSIQWMIISLALQKKILESLLNRHQPYPPESCGMTNIGEWTLLRSIPALRWCNVDTVFELPLNTSRRLAARRMQMFIRSCAYRERSGPILTWNDMKCLHPHQSEKTSWVLYWHPMWEYLLGCEQLKFSQATLNKQSLPHSLASTLCCFHGNNRGGLWLRLSHTALVWLIIF